MTKDEIMRLSQRAHYYLAANNGGEAGQILGEVLAALESALTQSEPDKTAELNVLYHEASMRKFFGTNPAPEAKQEPVRDEYEEGYQAASRHFRDRIEPYRLEAQSYKEAYFKLLEQMANLKAIEPPAPIILTNPAPVNTALLDVVKRIRQWDALGIPDTDGAFWKRELDAAIAAATGEVK